MSSDDTNNSANTEHTAVSQDAHLSQPYIYHLVQKTLWADATQSDSFYFPPTYAEDGFTHATANPDLLLNVANHFYTDVAGDWQCLQMTMDSLKDSGVDVVFEGTAPVGDIQPDFDGTDDELFPHILGGIHPSAVLAVYPVTRANDGTFLTIDCSK